MNRRRQHAAIAVLALVLIGCSSNGAGGDDENDGGGGSVTYSVIYDANGATVGNVPGDATRYEAGASVDIAANVGDLRRDGYPSWLGWNTAADGSGFRYMPGTTVSMPNRDLTLYAAWIEGHRLEPDPFLGRFSTFGSSVAVSGDYAIVGAPREPAMSFEGAVYIYEQTERGWSEVQKISGGYTAQFGSAVAISGDYAIVGSKELRRSGAAYLLERTGSTWSRTLLSGGSQDDLLGASVAISGNHAIIGSPGEDGNGKDAGAAYIYEITGTGWQRVQRLVAFGVNLPVFAEFGTSVAIAGDYAIVGAPGNTNSAHIFERGADGKWRGVAKLTSADPGPFDQFGSAVAIAADYAVVGTGEVYEEKGRSVYVFERRNGSWIQVQELTSPDTGGDNFGVSVAMVENRIVVGASEGVTGGSAYVFERTSNGWRLLQRLAVADAAANNRLGSSVAISEDHVIIGVPFDDNAGSAHVSRH